MRRLLLGAALCAAVLAGGCGGYDDENWLAARDVAQAFLDAQQGEDAARACQLLAPETDAAFAAAGGGSCAKGLTPPAAEGRLRATDVFPVPGSGLNPRLGVRVRQQPDRLLVVGRYGSTWLVVDAGAVPTP